MKRNLIYANIIYNSILIGVVVVFVSLSLIKIPITISSRGTIRPALENNKILSMVSGLVTYSKLHKNNQLVSKGDTLLKITSDVLRNKIRHQDILNKDYRDQLDDLNNQPII